MTNPLGQLWGAIKKNWVTRGPQNSAVKSSSSVVKPKVSVSFDDLSVDVLQHICTFVELREIPHVSRCDKSMNQGATRAKKRMPMTLNKTQWTAFIDFGRIVSSVRHLHLGFPLDGVDLRVLSQLTTLKCYVVRDIQFPISVKFLQVNSTFMNSNNLIHSVSRCTLLTELHIHLDTCGTPLISTTLFPLVALTDLKRFTFSGIPWTAEHIAVFETMPVLEALCKAERDSRLLTDKGWSKSQLALLSGMSSATRNRLVILDHPQLLFHQAMADLRCRGHSDLHMLCEYWPNLYALQPTHPEFIWHFLHMIPLSFLQTRTIDVTDLQLDLTRIQFALPPVPKYIVNEEAVRRDAIIDNYVEVLTDCIKSLAQRIQAFTSVKLFKLRLDANWDLYIVQQLLQDLVNGMPQLHRIIIQGPERLEFAACYAQQRLRSSQIVEFQADLSPNVERPFVSSAM